MWQFPSSQDWLWTTNSCCKLSQWNSEYRPPLFLCTVRAQWWWISITVANSPVSNQHFHLWASWHVGSFASGSGDPAVGHTDHPLSVPVSGGVGTQEMGHIAFSKRPAIQCGYCLNETESTYKIPCTRLLQFHKPDWSFISRQASLIPRSSE